MENKICTGFSDSNAKLIKVTDLIKMNTTINKDVHGEWTVYEIVKKGTVAVASYLYSDKGQVLSKGYTGCPLSNLYDTQDILMSDDISTIAPVEELFIIDPKQV